MVGQSALQQKVLEELGISPMQVIPVEVQESPDEGQVEVQTEHSLGGAGN